MKPPDARYSKRQRHSRELRQSLHQLGQRYRDAWERAECLQAELAHIKGSRLYRLLCWARRLLRRPEFTAIGEAPLAPFVAEILEDHRVPAVGTVSVVIPFKDRIDLLRPCLRSVLASRPRPDEIVLVDHDSTCLRTLRYLRRLQRRRGVRLVRATGPFNFARLCNEGARQATGDFLVFLNNDVDMVDCDWLDQLRQLAAHPAVGVVGATLLYPDHTLQHAGIFPRVNGQWTHLHRGRPAAFAGDAGELHLVRSVPAVTAACLMLRRQLFHDLAGFDENYPLTFNDVDLCCRVRGRGLKVAVTPHARLYHFESLSRGLSRENQFYDPPSSPATEGPNA